MGSTSLRCGFAVEKMCRNNSHCLLKGIFSVSTVHRSVAPAVPGVSVRVRFCSVALSEETCQWCLLLGPCTATGVKRNFWAHAKLTPGLCQCKMTVRCLSAGDSLIREEKKAKADKISLGLPNTQEDIQITLLHLNISSSIVPFPKRKWSRCFSSMQQCRYRKVSSILLH